MFVNDQKAGETRVEKTVPARFSADETFDVGQDKQTPVDDKDYQCPFVFTGQLTKLTVQLEAVDLALQEFLEFQQKSQRNNKSSE